MPIDKLLSNAAFDPETVRLFALALDTAWDTLQTSGSPLAADDQAAATRDVLAKRIIELGKQGERDPQRLAAGALAHLAGGK